MKETESYRPILESILSQYGKHYLSTTEVMEFTGRGREWCRNHLDLRGGGITSEALALKLSKL